MNHIAQEVVWPCIIQDITKALYHITVGKHFSKKKKAIWKFHQTYIQIFPFTIGSSFTQSRSYIYPVLVYIFRSFTFKINVIIISFNMKERHYSLCSEYHSTRNAFGQHWKLTTNNSRLTWKLHHSFLAYCLRCPALNAHLCQRNNSSLKPIKSIYFHQKWKHFHINLVLWYNVQGCFWSNCHFIDKFTSLVSVFRTILQVKSFRYWVTSRGDTSCVLHDVYPSMATSTYPD